MNSSIYILIVEDEAVVLDAIQRDVQAFEATFPLEMAQSAEEALEVIEELEEAGERIGLILCDHILPGQNGVDLLIDLQKRSSTSSARKVLVTGQAGHEDTINAVNKAGLDYYISKPWKEEKLLEVVRHELTEYIIDQKLNPLPYLSILESERLVDFMRTHGTATDR